MKKVIVLAMLLVGITAMAQQGEKKHKGHAKAMSAEQIATLQTKKMTLALDLTETQQGQMQALHLEHAKMRKTKMKERSAKQEEGEKRERTSDEIYAMKKARLDAAIAHKAALKNILTEEQFEKWEKVRHANRRHQRGKHSGHKRAKKRE